LRLTCLDVAGAAALRLLLALASGFPLALDAAAFRFGAMATINA